MSSFNIAKIFVILLLQISVEKVLSEFEAADFGDMVGVAQYTVKFQNFRTPNNFL